MKIDGGCHCGKITYKAEIDPEKVLVCHCTDCQILSGTAFRSVATTLPGGFELLSGEPRIYVKIAEDGNKRAQAFCPDCGTQLYATGLGDEPKVYGVRAGTARQRAQLTPKRQIWHRSAVNWLANLGELPGTEKQ